MRFRHPFEWLSPRGQNTAFVAFFLLAIVLMVTLQALGNPLATDTAPAGIVSFELAGDLTTAGRIIDSWGSAGRVYAGLNLGVDFLFLVTYSGAIALGCALAARVLTSMSSFLGTMGIALSWGQFAAALLDAVENIALIRLLLGSQQAAWPVVARWCALPKFALVAAGLLYVIMGGVVWLATITVARRKR